jgi:hypothetical protein
MPPLNRPSSAAASLRGAIGQRLGVAGERDAGWGWLPALSLVSALGLLLAAVANSAAPSGAPWSEPLFWSGLTLLFTPTALRLLMAEPARRERLALAALLGCGLYLLKLMHSPLTFTFSDELQHWRTALEIQRSGVLFRENPLLPVSALYPGLESVTTALAELGGLSIYTAGIIVIGVGRLVGMLGLFLFYERVSGSPRAAGLAALLYTANPSYLFFGAQFAYESLAVPLSVLTLFAAARRIGDAPGLHFGLTASLLLGLGAVVVTHHLTSYALLAFLALWALVATFGRVERPRPHGLALLALAASTTWLVYVATLTVTYLSAPLTGAVVATLQLIAGEGTARELFRASTGDLAPLWERGAGFGAVALILLGLPLGLWAIWRGARGTEAGRMSVGLAVTLGLAALGYPASLVMRLTERGAEISNRASAFMFLAVAFVLACWVARHLPRAGESAKWLAVYGLCATVIFTGGVVVGWPPWARLPGPYLAAADTRSIERQGLAAAGWAREALGPGNRLIADRTNRLLMGTYGEQRPVTNYRDQVKVAQVFFAPEVGPAELRLLRRGAVRYVVVDRRLSTALPAAAVYVERGEPNAGRHVTPIDPAALAKFDALPGVSRVFDSGDIAIYDVGALTREE